MSDDDRGVPVYRQISPWAHLPEYIYSANDPKITDEPGRWFPEDVASALLDLLQATRESDGELIVDAMARLYAFGRPS